MNLKKTLASLIFGLAGSLVTLPASAQTTVIVDMEAVLCALLPYELQGACQNDFSPVGSARGEAIRVCSTLTNSYYRNDCYSVVQNANYSTGALRACSRIQNDYNKIECLRSTRNGYYQSEAVDICTNLNNSYYAMDCVNKTRNKIYDFYEIEACSREYNAYNAVECMSRFGRKITSGGNYPAPRYPTPTPAPRYPSPTPGFPSPGSGTCEVHNSSSYVTSVRRSEFMQYAKEFAAEQRSCVVTNYHNQERSRSLIGPRGGIQASNLTEREVNELKRERGYDRCRILTCK